MQAPLYSIIIADYDVRYSYARLALLDNPNYYVRKQRQELQLSSMFTVKTTGRRLDVSRRLNSSASLL